MFDIRLHSTLDAVLHPSPKEGMNPRSLGFLNKVTMLKTKCVLFATFPKSGWNWAGDIMNYCLVKQHTGGYRVAYEGEGTLKDRERKPYRIVVPADGRCWDQRKIRRAFPKVDVDYIFHTHGAWKESPLWWLDQARTVFIIRNIPTTLYSYYKSRATGYAGFEDCLEKTGALKRIINFYNGWGDFAASPGTSSRSFRYEDLRESPAEGFADMYGYVFGEPVSKDVLQEALDYFSFSKQKEREFKFESDESKHFHFKGSSDYTDKIAPETLKRIETAIRTSLRHSFGYEYN